MAKYDKEIVKTIIDLIEADSYTIAEICKIAKINIDTYYDWIKRKPEFSEAVKKAKQRYEEYIIIEARRSLNKLIKGYTVDETKTVFVDNKGGKPRIKEQIVVKKHFQPNVAATIFLLTNKVPDEFKNRQNSEITGKDGKDLVPARVLTKQEAKELLKQLEDEL